jgi:hypothetical protein
MYNRDALTTLPGKARWHLDRLVSRGFFAILGSIVVVFVLLIAGGAALRAGIMHEPYLEACWTVFERLIDPSSLQKDEEWQARFLSVVFVFLGIVATAFVVAVSVTSLEASIERVRNGATRLPRAPDLLVLGWSDEIGTLLTEYAQGSSRVRDVAVLSDRSRVDMERDAALALGHFRGRVRVHCRTARRSDPRQLSAINVSRSKSVVIVGTGHEHDEADAVKTVFSVLSAEAEFRPDVLIAELSDDAVAVALAKLFGSELTAVNSTEVLSLVLAQCARGPGMTQLIDQLTSYRGGEFYEHPIPKRYTGRPFASVALDAHNMSPIGIVRAGVPMLLPKMSIRLEEGDHLIVVDGKFREIVWSETVLPQEIEDAIPQEPSWNHQDLLFVGWNRIVARSVKHLRGFLAPEAAIHVLADASMISRNERRVLESNEAVNRITWCDGAEERLEAIQSIVAEHTYDAVALVPYREAATPAQSDADTLVSLAGLKSVLKDPRTRIITELRESQSAELTTVARPDDLLLSDAVTASLMAQMLDRPWLDSLLGDLLDFHGSALFMVDPSRAGSHGRTTTYGELRQKFAAIGELSIGYVMNGRVILNPDADETVSVGDISSVIVVGAGLLWDQGMTPARLSWIEI